MREIKLKFLLRCRERKVVTKPYFLGDLIDPDGYIDVISEYNADEILEYLLFTGLKDKNGVEIYEGYILQYQNITAYRSLDRQKGVVEYYRNFFATKIDGGYHSLHNIQCVVIGNIYENPELLEVEDES